VISRRGTTYVNDIERLDTHEVRKGYAAKREQHVDGRVKLTSTKLMKAYPTLKRETPLVSIAALQKEEDKFTVYSLAVIGKVDAQVHEIVFSPAGLVNDPLEHRLVDLIGDVSKHDLRTAVS
jgi:hypothetical protein